MVALCFLIKPDRVVTPVSGFIEQFSIYYEKNLITVITLIKPDRVVTPVSGFIEQFSIYYEKNLITVITFHRPLPNSIKLN